MDLLAFIGFIYMTWRALRDKSTNVYLDNINALCALIRDDRYAAVIADMAAWRRRALQAFGIDVWMAQMGSMLNIAYRPERSAGSLPYDVLLDTF